MDRLLTSRRRFRRAEVRREYYDQQIRPRNELHATGCTPQQLNFGPLGGQKKGDTEQSLLINNDLAAGVFGVSLGVISACFCTVIVILDWPQGAAAKILNYRDCVEL